MTHSDRYVFSRLQYRLEGVFMLEASSYPLSSKRRLFICTSRVRVLGWLPLTLRLLTRRSEVRVSIRTQEHAAGHHHPTLENY